MVHDTHDEHRRRISEKRQTLYYGGMALTGLGFLLFLSVFVTGISQVGNPGRLGGDSSGGAATAFIGILMMMGGSAMMKLGAKGLAGSGVILDPQRARRDLEPWSRMKGGMVHDAVSEIDAVNELKESLKNSLQSGRTVVKIRCRSCQALNSEHAKFCNQCGAML